MTLTRARFEVALTILMKIFTTTMLLTFSSNAYPLVAFSSTTTTRPSLSLSLSMLRSIRQCQHGNDVANRGVLLLSKWSRLCHSSSQSHEHSPVALSRRFFSVDTTGRRGPTRRRSLPSVSISTNCRGSDALMLAQRCRSATQLCAYGSSSLEDSEDDDGMRLLKENTNSPFTDGSPFSFGDTTITTTSFAALEEMEGREEESNSSSNTSDKVAKLKTELSQYRKQQSETLLRSPSFVLNNATLDAISNALPKTKEELLEVKGVGPKKIDMFGDDILSIVSKYLDDSSDDINDTIDDNDDDGKKEDTMKGTRRKIRKTQLREDLKQYRIRQSTPLNRPAYTIFTNAALEGIYATLPTTKEELINVKGIGPNKIEMFGDDILSIVSKYAGCARDDIYDSSLNVKGGNNIPVPRPALIDPNSLTDEQRQAAELPLGPDRPNVFITGSAGTGKSYLLRYIVQALRANSGRTVGICAPTGVAAIIVNGSTLHSFFGIGLGTGSISSLVKKVAKNAAAMKRIDETDVLIIDECSMLSSDLLEILDLVVREVRDGGKRDDVPFGGMQIIAFGDFFQLPPVYRGTPGDDRRWRPFCFDSPVWADLGLSENVLMLQDVQRQEDGDFVRLLNRVRLGAVDEGDIAALNAQCLTDENTRPLPTDGIIPTRLYVLNRDVDAENESRLADLDGDEVVCEARNVWREKMPLDTLASVKKNMMDSIRMELPDEVRLKVGAQVMLTRNKDLEKNLVNGSRGVVERFVSGAPDTKEEGMIVPIVRFDCGIVTKVAPVESVRYNPDGGAGCLVKMQVPLKLAWAITIHKSQGSTLTRASLDMTSAFEYGQCYVALSRVKSLDGLWLERPAQLQNIKVSPQVVTFFRNNRMDKR